MIRVEPVTLEGDAVRLVPTSLDHREALTEVCVACSVSADFSAALSEL